MGYIPGSGQLGSPVGQIWCAASVSPAQLKGIKRRSAGEIRAHGHDSAAGLHPRSTVSRTGLFPTCFLQPGGPAAPLSLCSRKPASCRVETPPPMWPKGRAAGHGGTALSAAAQSQVKPWPHTVLPVALSLSHQFCKFELHQRLELGSQLWTSRGPWAQCARFTGGQRWGLSSGRSCDLHPGCMSFVRGRGAARRTQDSPGVSVPLSWLWRPPGQTHPGGRLRLISLPL